MPHDSSQVEIKRREETYQVNIWMSEFLCFDNCFEQRKMNKMNPTCMEMGLMNFFCYDLMQTGRSGSHGVYWSQ